jgi:hypothetical protein
MDRSAALFVSVLTLASSACLTSAPSYAATESLSAANSSSAETQQDGITEAPQRISVKGPEGDVPLGNPVELTVTLAPGELLGELEVVQSSTAGFSPSQGGGPARIVREDGLTKTIQIVPAQIGPLDVLIFAVYADRAFARQIVHLNVVACAKGLKRFYLNQGFPALPLVLEDKEEDRQSWLSPEVEYKDLKYPIYLNDSSQIKLSVQQDEANPVIRVDKNGMVHALRKGKAVIVGDFDGVIDRIAVSVYTKEGAPAGYRRVHD